MLNSAGFVLPADFLFERSFVIQGKVVGEKSFVPQFSHLESNPPKKKKIGLTLVEKKD